jgi:hypothetical protein
MISVMVKNQLDWVISSQAPKEFISMVKVQRLDGLLFILDHIKFLVYDSIH